MTRLPITLLWVVLLMSLNGLKVQAQVAAQDSLALVALYNATDGPNWADNTNWLSSPVPSWHGVQTSGDRVIILDLADNQLNGSLTEEIWNLTSLQSLSLSNNQISGSIPSAVANLSDLVILELDQNQISSTIPKELGNLRDVVILKLDYNQLIGTIPKELRNLTGLLELGLAHNQLIGTIPNELGFLANIQRLRLSSNNLIGTIPSILGNPRGLLELDLSNNQLSGIIPTGLGSLDALLELFLNSNPFTGNIPSSFTNLSMLVTFNFADTDLCEPPDQAFQTWLQGVQNLTSTGITCVPTATENREALPSEYVLESNYPNPFNPTTLIRYALPQRAPVRLSVYDVQGRRVAVLVALEQPAGWHEVRFEAGALPSGVYFYRLEAGAFREVRQMLLLR